MREKTTSEYNDDEELAEYKRNMDWLQECKKGFPEWYDKYARTPDKGDKKVRGIARLTIGAGIWVGLTYYVAYVKRTTWYMYNDKKSMMILYSKI